MTPEEFEVFYTTHAPHWLRMAQAFTQSEPDARDAIQDTAELFLRDRSAIVDTNPRAMFTTKLHWILRERHMKRPGKQKNAKMEWYWNSEPMEAHLQTLQVDVCDTVDMSERDQRVEHALLTLREEYQDALRLRFVAGWSLGEIARLYGVPHRIYHSRFHHVILPAFRRALGRVGIPAPPSADNRTPGTTETAA